MATKQVVIWESAADGWSLKLNNLNLHLARPIRLVDGTIDCNTVWQCKAIGPRRRTVGWTPQYGLSWTYAVPAAGSDRVIQPNGPWQMFDQSEAFDIFPNGTWRVSSSAGRPGWLTIGQNKFYPKRGRDLHVVIGAWDVDTRSFTPIYVDPSPLAFGQSTSYQILESIQFWYEANDVPFTRISGAGLRLGEVDLSARDPVTAQYYATATYVFEHDEWRYSAEAPPGATSSGLLGGALPGPSERVRRAIASR